MWPLKIVPAISPQCFSIATNVVQIRLGFSVRLLRLTSVVLRESQIATSHVLVHVLVHGSNNKSLQRNRSLQPMYWYTKVTSCYHHPCTGACNAKEHYCVLIVLVYCSIPLRARHDCACTIVNETSSCFCTASLCVHQEHAWFFTIASIGMTTSARVIAK